MVTPSLQMVGGTEFLIEDDVAALGAERDLDGVGEGVDAVAQGLTSVLVEQQCLGHIWVLLLVGVLLLVYCV